MTDLSLQLPAWPTVLVPMQRMMMFVAREGPEQKAPPAEGQMKESLLLLLRRQVEVSSVLMFGKYMLR